MAAEELLQANEDFMSVSKVEFMNELRKEMEEDGVEGACMSVCQETGYCTEGAETVDKMWNAENAPDRFDEKGNSLCHWCYVVHQGDKRTSISILQEIVKSRSTGRH